MYFSLVIAHLSQSVFGFVARPPDTPCPFSSTLSIPLTFTSPARLPIDMPLLCASVIKCSAWKLFLFPIERLAQQTQLYALPEVWVTMCWCGMTNDTLFDLTHTCFIIVLTSLTFE